MLICNGKLWMLEKNQQKTKPKNPLPPPLLKPNRQDSISSCSFCRVIILKYFFGVTIEAASENRWSKVALAGCCWFQWVLVGIGLEPKFKLSKIGGAWDENNSIFYLLCFLWQGVFAVRVFDLGSCYLKWLNFGSDLWFTQYRGR